MRLSLPALLVVVSSAIACVGSVEGTPAPLDFEDPTLGTGADELVDECDRSSFNCKLPASKRDRNRIFNEATDSYDWPIAPGTPLLDGLGNPRGNVKESSVRINFGERKKIGGVAHVYAFAIALDTGIHASGWVRESALKHGPIERMPTVAGRDPGEGDYDAVWQVTGGDNAKFGELKVNKDFTGGGREATDYLLRPGGYVNLLYNLPLSGGVSIDTFPAGVIFRRSKGVPELSIDLYAPGSSKVSKTMPFIYGHIGDRWGWIARDALVRRDVSGPISSGGGGGGGGGSSSPPPTPPASGVCYVRCCDGGLVGPLATMSAAACHDASQAACSGRGYVRRSEWNGGEVYERDTSCYAKCRARDAYHRLDGVTKDCTTHAKAFCAESSRGGLQDAAWSQCTPT